MNKIKFNFNDEIANKIIYNDEKQFCEIHFEAYYDMDKDQIIEHSCIFRINHWSEVSGKFWSDKEYKIGWNLNLLVNLFKISNELMILSMDMVDNDLYITFDLGTSGSKDDIIAHVYDVCFKNATISFDKTVC